MVSFVFWWGILPFRLVLFTMDLVGLYFNFFPRLFLAFGEGIDLFSILEGDLFFLFLGEDFFESLFSLHMFSLSVSSQFL